MSFLVFCTLEVWFIVVLSINETHIIPINMPIISPFGIDGNPERLHYSA
jgi:hypothetical protein